MKTKFAFRLALMLLLSLCLLPVEAADGESNATTYGEYGEAKSAADGDSEQININWAYLGKILGLLFVVGLSVAVLLVDFKANWPMTFRVIGGLSFIVCTLSVFCLFIGEGPERVLFLKVALVGFTGFIANYVIAHFLEVTYQVRDDLAAIRASQQGDTDEE